MLFLEGVATGLVAFEAFVGTICFRGVRVFTLNRDGKLSNVLSILFCVTFQLGCTYEY